MEIHLDVADFRQPDGISLYAYRVALVVGLVDCLGLSLLVGFRELHLYSLALAAAGLEEVLERRLEVQLGVGKRKAVHLGEEGSGFLKERHLFKFRHAFLRLAVLLPLIVLSLVVIKESVVDIAHAACSAPDGVCLLLCRVKSITECLHAF